MANELRKSFFESIGVPAKVAATLASPNMQEIVAEDLPCFNIEQVSNSGGALRMEKFYASCAGSIGAVTPEQLRRVLESIDRNRFRELVIHIGDPVREELMKHLEYLDHLEILAIMGMPYRVHEPSVEDKNMAEFVRHLPGKLNKLTLCFFTPYIPNLFQQVPLSQPHLRELEIQINLRSDFGPVANLIQQLPALESLTFNNVIFEDPSQQAGGNDTSTTTMQPLVDAIQVHGPTNLKKLSFLHMQFTVSQLKMWAWLIARLPNLEEIVFCVRKVVNAELMDAFEPVLNLVKDSSKLTKLRNIKLLKDIRGEQFGHGVPMYLKFPLDDKTKRGLRYRTGIVRAKSILGDDSPSLHKSVLALVAYRNRVDILDHLLTNFPVLYARAALDRLQNTGEAPHQQNHTQQDRIQEARKAQEEARNMHRERQFHND
ncbi:expressed unknown protein [Seminavis robusta]|uniref:Uncharacterized protein n=1 Tax=Seminavis robusta TaxID=568900 RepID=A0A9N8EWG2_9STRA|nr:expressed unknown protein [Seminavis robusta]|eukprot:Sro2502_g329510.1 n/a (430) ;mRNA; r:7994-9283